MDAQPITEDSQLYKDLVALDSLYEELLWSPEDDLQFGIEYLRGKGRIVITNKSR